MNTSRPLPQSWLIAFAALTGLMSMFPYRERALLPTPSAQEQGFLAQEIARQGSDQLVNDSIAGRPGAIVDEAVAGPGARRLIAALTRPGSVPGTSGFGTGLGTGAGGLPGAPGGLPGDAGNGAPAGVAPDGGNVGLVPQSANPQVQPGPSPVNPLPTAPQGPTVLAGTAGELLAAVVPEPSTWMMFIAGLFGIGQVLRRTRRRMVMSPQV